MLYRTPPTPPTPTISTQGDSLGVTYMDAKHEAAIKVEVDE
jgi:hypothetical protein